MTTTKMTQSEIDDLLKDSDFQESIIKNSRIQTQSRVITKKQQVVQNDSENYGDSFEDYEESKAKSGSGNGRKVNFESSANQYGDQDFESYEESRKTAKSFERSQNKSNNNKNSKTKNQGQGQTQAELTAIKQQQLQKNSTTGKKTNNFIVSGKPTASASYNTSYNHQSPNHANTAKNFKKSSSNSKQKPQKHQIIIMDNHTPLSKTSTNAKHLPYKFDKLQERERELLLTSITEQNKRLKAAMSERDKQMQQFKIKYNILMEQKSQTLSNSKQAALNKKYSILQEKYNNLLKQKGNKDRSQKSVQGIMAKTMGAGSFIPQDQVNEREEQLVAVIDKLKERLINTDKQLKTLQNKMNQGLDYQEELQRKLKRVEQLDLRIQKMKIQAQQDRSLIDILKQKTKEQKRKIEDLNQEKNQLHVALKRAQMSQITHSDIMEQLQETKKQKQMLEKSLKELTQNFSKSVMASTTNGNKVSALRSQIESIQDSGELLSSKVK